MTSKNCLFDENILKELDYSDFKGQFKQTIENPAIGFANSLFVRPLNISDYNSGFLEVLKQLTSVGEISQEVYEKRFNCMQESKDYFVAVIEDRNSGKVIGTGSLVLEQKFIHQCSLKGKIEEVVVCESYRGKELGKLLIAILVKLSKHLQCYKVTLDCDDHMIPFYESFGFKKNKNFMQIYF